eukprot:6204378-Pleurochrysis_carterae.AAC.3
MRPPAPETTTLLDGLRDSSISARHASTASTAYMATNRSGPSVLKAGCRCVRIITAAVAAAAAAAAVDSTIMPGRPLALRDTTVTGLIVLRSSSSSSSKPCGIVSRTRVSAETEKGTALFGGGTIAMPP